ncbi:unnamed protein product [Durusdinium trenchii]|uniref:Arf-GAP domain-containing protein n=1 Tax=Durusdinium trenchii TaxID=1381693 RepID=A0ABP0SXC0_9DINO
MASWLSGRVASLVRELGADELTATLEQRARALSSPHSAAWLLSHWLEQCSNSEVYVLQMKTGSWHLSFMQVLLRSNAFELALESCAKQSSLREALTPGTNASSQLLEHSRALRQALHQMAERLLLPGALEVWPSLFDALLTDATHAPLPWDAWARRLITALKRPWQSEALGPQLSRWDGKAAEEASANGYEETTASAASTSAALKGGAKLSKQSIRAEMTRRRLPQLTLEANRLRRRTELLCQILEALRVVDEQNNAGSKEIQQLISDAGLALESLDSGLEGSEAEQKSLGQALSDCSGELQRQMAAVMLTQEAFVERRGKLQDERAKLQKRFEELNAEITQLDTEVRRCNGQVQQLQAQFSQNTSHYDGLLGGSSNVAMKLCERKSKAGAFRGTAEAALSLAKAAEARRRPDLLAQQRRRQVQLGRQMSTYLHQERLRLSAIADCAQVEEGSALPDLTVTSQEAWRAAQALLQRVDALVGHEKKDVSAEAAEPAVSTVDAEDFFSKIPEKDRTCADCNSQHAEWASVSYGIYLCVECAGQHRGFGVHLSFVRSVAMDRWTPTQLRTMEVGGTERFLKFFSHYPRLKGRNRLWPDVPGRSTGRGRGLAAGGNGPDCGGDRYGRARCNFGNRESTAGGHVPGTSGQTAGCHESKQFLGTSGAVHRSHQKL